MKNAYSTYRTANVDTTDQGKLIIITYDVAIKHCRLALDMFGSQNQIAERTAHLLKAQDAVNELMSSLKLDVGEVAQNLYRLYDYIVRRIIHANAHNEQGCITEVLGYMEDLREAWKEAIIISRGTKAESTEIQKTIAISG